MVCWMGRLNRPGAFYFPGPAFRVTLVAQPGHGEHDECYLELTCVRSRSLSRLAYLSHSLGTPNPLARSLRWLLLSRTNQEVPRAASERKAIVLSQKTTRSYWSSRGLMGFPMSG